VTDALIVITKTHVYKVNFELIEGDSAVIEVEEIVRRGGEWEGEWRWWIWRSGNAVALPSPIQYV
jgi:hypothetical protein